MTEQQLRVLEEQAKADGAEADGACSTCFGWTQSGLGLVAEVRRLRGLIKDAETRGCDEYERSEHCPWCRRPMRDMAWNPGAAAFENIGGHAGDCPAFLAPGVVR